MHATARVLRCEETIPGCARVIEGRDNAEVMARFVDHIRKDHGMKAPPFEFVTRAHATIRDKVSGA
jgi:predicted small metal-binding protein